MEPKTQTSAEVLLRLEEPFNPEDVKWLVAATRNNGRLGLVKPYADRRAYTDRLNRVVTPSGWTTQVTTDKVAVARAIGEKLVQTGKVMATCILTIDGIGTHCGTGEHWADDENGMTSADAQAFKRACTEFGLGRYFYSFPEMWVELNEKKKPKSRPALPAWALPTEVRSSEAGARSKQDATPNAGSPVTRGLLDASTTTKIESFRQPLGGMLYSSILGAVAKVRSARDIANQQVQRDVLVWMESGGRGLASIREMAVTMPETQFYAILNDAGVASLSRIPNLTVLKELVKKMKRAAPQNSAA